MTADLASGVRAALETFRERQAKFEDEAEDSPRPDVLYARADTWGEAAGLLAELTAVPVPYGDWPVQVSGDPFEVPIRGEAR